MTYLCPVCEYAKLARPPQAGVSCPQCGTEFGADDALTKHTTLKAKWRERGSPWFSRVVKKEADD